MIDQRQPPPGYTVESCDETALRFVIRRGINIIGYRGTESEAIESSHRIYAAESRPAVVDFAERMAAWLHGGHSYGFQEWMELEEVRPDFQTWAVAQILAAARGERTLP